MSQKPPSLRRVRASEESILRAQSVALERYRRWASRLGVYTDDRGNVVEPISRESQREQRRQHERDQARARSWEAAPSDLPAGAPAQASP